ncbi:hypothetical protein AB0092_29550, partial [Klebsiella pneumoniae]
RFTTICFRALLAPISFWHGRGGGPDEALSPSTIEVPDQRERLERIALYARAGYFRMGGPLDMMNMTGEIPLE